MVSPRFLRSALAVLAVLLPWAASATPVTYFFTSGSVTVTATVSGDLVAGPTTVALSGVSVTIDEGALTLNSISLSMGASGSVSISPPYLGFTSINIDFASLTATGGTLTLVDSGPPAEYSYLIAPVTVSGQFDAVNLIPANSLVDEYFGFVNPSASGTIFVDNGNGTLDLDGITLGTLDPDGEGGEEPLVLKGDFFFSGQVPEPGAGLLLGMGASAALALGASRRRRGAA
jgi:hypothetical protein